MTVGLLVDFWDGRIVGFTVGLTELGDLVGAVENLQEGEAVLEMLGMTEDGVKDFVGNAVGDLVGNNEGPDVVGLDEVGS